MPNGGSKSVVSAAFTRPANATAYAANDVVSDSATTTTPMPFALGRTEIAGSFPRGEGLGGYIVGARLTTNQESAVPAFRVHLYSDLPAVAADNAQFTRLYADDSKKIGSFDLAAMTSVADLAGASDSSVQDFTLRIPFVGAAGSRTIYAVLETLTIFTPASGQAFTLTLIAELD